MRSSSVALLVSSLVLAASMTPGLAGQANAPKSGQSRDFGGAAGKARILVSVGQAGSVVNSKGIIAMSHPGVGLFCFTPEIVPPTKAVGIATVDYDRSLGNGSLAQWGGTGWGCPAGQFAVRTFSFSEGAFVPSNLVAFTFVVP